MSETRVTRTVVVTDPAGVHARTAVAIAETVRRGKSQVTLMKVQAACCGNRCIADLDDGGPSGETVTLEAVGPDAEAVLSALEPLFAGRFGDEAPNPLIADAETSRDCRFAGRGHRRGVGDGQRGISHPSAVCWRDAVVDEFERLDKAIAAAAGEIAHHRETVSAELGEKYGGIFEAHLQMLQDSRLRGELEEMIRQRHYSPEYAVSRTLRRYAQVFQRLETSYLAERASDIFDIEKRLCGICSDAVGKESRI